MEAFETFSFSIECLQRLGVEGSTCFHPCTLLARGKRYGSARYVLLEDRLRLLQPIAEVQHPLGAAVLLLQLAFCFAPSWILGTNQISIVMMGRSLGVRVGTPTIRCLQRPGGGITACVELLSPSVTETGGVAVAAGSI